MVYCYIFRGIGGVGMAFDKVKYDNEYTRQNYDRQEFLLPKGKKAVLKKVAMEHGKTVSELIIEALETCYHVDLSRQGGE